MDVTYSDFSERQFLVTDYQASIMSNMVAMALTISGPRLWFLIKRLVLWTHREFLLWRRMRGKSNLESDVRSNTMEIIDESHSELGAALRLWRHISFRLRPRVELLDNPAWWENATAGDGRIAMLKKVCKNFLRRSLDIFMSILLSLAFVGIFVVVSTGSVLSAGIVVGDTTALSSSRLCEPPGHSDILFTRAASYSQQCYRKPAGTDGCGYFYSQDIPYKVISDRDAIKSEEHIYQGHEHHSLSTRRNETVSFDTGLLDSSIIGINAKKRYQFRRKTTCTLVASEQKDYQSLGMRMEG